jgi:dCMP deaminase
MISQDDIDAMCEPEGLNWPDYLMGFARHAASKSKDSTKVGAVLVGPNNEVLLTAFNGPPIGVADLPERRNTRPEKYLWVSHSEANLIAFAARRGIRTEGCTVYVTHCPCSGCAKSLIQAGIKKVIMGTGMTSMPPDEFRAATTMLREAGVELVEV